MRIIHSDENTSFSERFISKGSIFLAGPTPRSKEVPSWRPEAIEYLRKYDFLGTVLVPERANWEENFDYMQQVEWEYEGLEHSTVIAFWIPRNLETLPGFTTNVEFGRYLDSTGMIYGRPDDAPNNRYLDWLYTKITKQKPINFLETLMQIASSRAKR